MSTKQQDTGIVVPATVTEALPNAMFRVRMQNSTKTASDENLPAENSEMIAYLGGRMKFNRIKVLVGDRVDVLLDPYGGKGRIIKRG
jgi:translation initiation factor IF-1